VHESEVQSRQSTAETVSPARQDVVASAQKLAKGRKPALQELEIVQFRDDRGAHDDALHNRLRREFAQRLKSLQKEMSMTFGPPDETGTDDHEAIPLNGVFQYAIWRTGNQRLFVAAAHEDRELPYLIMLGTTPRARK
jgi:hypothetical protein